MIRQLMPYVYLSGTVPLVEALLHMVDACSSDLLIIDFTMTCM
jgi:hypothetical protein